MRARHLIIVIALLGIAPSSWAQVRSSRRYVPIPFDGDLESMLRDRLAQATDWEEFLKKMPDGLKRLAPQLEKMKDDERFRELLRMLKDQKLDKIRWPENLKDLEKVIKKQIDKRGIPPVTVKPKPEFPIKGAGPVQPPLPVKPNPKPPRKDELQDRFDRWVKDRLQDAEGSNIGDMLRDSPAWRKTIDDLGRSLANVRPGGDGWDLRGVLEKWPLADNLKLPAMEKWLKPPNWSLPELPRLQVSMPGWRLDNPLGGVRLPALPGARSMGGWQIVLWALAAIAAAFILWQVWKSLERRGERASIGWSPGPWPMVPANVATRADLVACFDHLSLRLLGQVAESWNHRSIAERLAGTGEDARRQTADELAALYEWARYSPGDGPLPPDRVDEARRALEFFARLRPMPAGK